VSPRDVQRNIFVGVMAQYIILLYQFITTIHGIPVDYEPYSLLHIDKIVAFFPFDTHNLSNIAPSFSYAIDGLTFSSSPE
jgi:hypothetical protein